MPDKGKDRIIGIFAPIALGVEAYGSFVTAFADAVCRADPENFELIRPLAVQLIAKYNLGQGRTALPLEDDAA